MNSIPFKPKLIHQNTPIIFPLPRKIGIYLFNYKKFEYHSFALFLTNIPKYRLKCSSIKHLKLIETTTI